MEQPDALRIYKGNDGDETKRYYALLALSGEIGTVAMNLFRAQKCSARAKVYRGGIRGKGSFRSMAYERKGWSLDQLCKVLALQAERLGLRFGWKRDPKMDDFDPCWVLYVDLPEGQVSFHSKVRYSGPDYPGEWDGVKDISAQRIIRFCDRVVTERLAPTKERMNGKTETQGNDEQLGQV